MQQGNIVQLHRTVLRSGAEKTLVTLAFVLGVITEPGYASEDGSPALNLAYLDPDRSNLIGSTDWRNAFDRESAVKHQAHADVANESERVFYTTLDELTAGDHALVELGQISEFVRKAFPDASGENVAELVIGLLDEKDANSEAPSDSPHPDTIKLQKLGLFLQGNFAGEIDTNADVVDDAIRILGRTPRKLTAEEEAASGLAKQEQFPASFEEIKEKVVQQLDEVAPSTAIEANEPSTGDQGTDSPNQTSEAAGV